MDLWIQSTIEHAEHVKDLRYDAFGSLQWNDIDTKRPDGCERILIAWLDVDGETGCDDVPVMVREAEYVDGMFYCAEPVAPSSVLMWACMPEPSKDALWGVFNRKCALESARLATQPEVDDGIPF